MKKKKIIITAVVVLVIMFVAIYGSFNRGGGDISETDSAETTPVSEQETPSPTLEPEPTPTPYTGPTNPLTGLPAEEDLSGNRPYAVMLNNLKAALPQQGVSQADIIYEALAEGGITRMLAIYQDISGVGIIGSVRSARHYYLDMAQAHDAIYIHAGGSPQAYTAISARGITNIDGVKGSGQIFYRDSARMNSAGYEHSLMTTSELIAAYVPGYNLRMEHSEGYASNMTFTDETGYLNGESVLKISVVYSTYKTGVFEYSEEEGVYYVNQYGEAYTDGNTGGQVSVSNVLVLYATVYQIAGDTAGRLETILTGSGSGYFASGGEYVPITWAKDSYSSQFEYAMEDGSPVVFGVGRSYVNIVPAGNTVTFE